MTDTIPIESARVRGMVHGARLTVGAEITPPDDEDEPRCTCSLRPGEKCSCSCSICSLVRERENSERAATPRRLPFTDHPALPAPQPADHIRTDREPWPHPQRDAQGRIIQS